MKYFTKSVYAVILSFVLLMMLSSCEQDKQNMTTLTFTEISHSERVFLFDNENMPSFSMEFQIKIPEDSIAFSKLYHSMVLSYFGEEYQTDKSIMENLQISTQEFTKEYRNNEEDLKGEIDDIGASYNWELQISNEVIFQDEDFVSFKNETYYFSGGAHGNTIRNYFIFDLAAKNILTSSDVFMAEVCNNIIELQQVSISKTDINSEVLYTDGFKCDHNFYLIKEGFVFHYDQYEIASYADGPIDIFLSFKEVEPYLNPKFAKRIISPK